MKNLAVLVCNAAMFGLMLATLIGFIARQL
jgi:hypothetical protein